MAKRHLRSLAGFGAVLSVAILAVACDQTSTPELQAALAPTPTPVTVFTTVTVQPSEAGTVDVVPEPNQGQGYREGTNLVLTAHATEGFRFNAWAGDLDGTSNPVSATLMSNFSVAAVFGKAPIAVVYVSIPSIGGRSVSKLEVEARLYASGAGSRPIWNK